MAACPFVDTTTCPCSLFWGGRNVLGQGVPVRPLQIYCAVLTPNAIISLALEEFAMAQVLVRNLTEKSLARLKHRARDHGRSLQSELRQILEQAASSNMLGASRLARRIRRELAGREHSDSAELVAEDRDR